MYGQAKYLALVTAFGRPALRARQPLIDLQLFAHRGSAAAANLTLLPESPAAG